LIEIKSTERSDRREKAILVKVLLSDGEYSTEDPLEEIRGLVKTAGLIVVGAMLQKRHQVDIATYIGSGKVEELKELVQAHEADLVVFDNDLGPAQTRNLEKALDVKVIEEAVKAPNEVGLTYVPNFHQFEHLRIYVRGYTQISRIFRSARTKFRKRTMVLDAYQRLVIILKFRPGLDLGPYVRSDVVYLRMFKDVPHVDMEMHLPEQGTRVKMRWIDKAQIASPVVMGVPALTMKVLGVGLARGLASRGIVGVDVSSALTPEGQDRTCQ